MMTPFPTRARWFALTYPFRDMRRVLLHILRHLGTPTPRGFTGDYSYRDEKLTITSAGARLSVMLVSGEAVYDLTPCGEGYHGVPQCNRPGKWMLHIRALCAYADEAQRAPFTTIDDDALFHEEVYR
jgi:hypothetical protein